MVTILFSGQKVCAGFYQAWINYDRNMVKYKPFKPQYPLTNSPYWSLYISIKN